MRGLWPFRLVLPVLLLVCAVGRASEALTVLTHANGLTISVPAALAATQTASGFRMQTRAAVRNPVVIVIELHDTLPPETLTRHRLVNRMRVRYRVTEEEGGSGGPEFRLEAARQMAARHIFLALTHQAEWPARPDFDLGWRILTSATVAARGN